MSNETMIAKAVQSKTRDYYFSSIEDFRKSGFDGTETELDLWEEKGRPYLWVQYYNKDGIIIWSDHAFGHIKMDVNGKVDTGQDYVSVDNVLAFGSAYEGIAEAFTPYVKKDKSIPTIKEVEFDGEGNCLIHVVLDNGDKERNIINFFTDEISFTKDELIGKTIEEARKIWNKKDSKFLKTLG